MFISITIGITFHKRNHTYKHTFLYEKVFLIKMKGRVGTIHTHRPPWDYYSHNCWFNGITICNYTLSLLAKLDLSDCDGYWKLILIISNEPRSKNLPKPTLFKRSNLGLGLGLLADSFNYSFIPSSCCVAEFCKAFICFTSISSISLDI